MHSSRTRERAIRVPEITLICIKEIGKVVRKRFCHRLFYIHQPCLRIYEKTCAKRTFLYKPDKQSSPPPPFEFSRTTSLQSHLCVLSLYSLTIVTPVLLHLRRTMTLQEIYNFMIYINEEAALPRATVSYVY